MRQVRTEARAEAEAAAAARFAAVLARERAEVDKRVRSLFSICGTWLHRLSRLYRECTQQNANGTAVHASHAAAWDMWWWGSAGMLQSWCFEIRHAFLIEAVRLGAPSTH